MISCKHLHCRVSGVEAIGGIRFRRRVGRDDLGKVGRFVSSVFLVHDPSSRLWCQGIRPTMMSDRQSYSCSEVTANLWASVHRYPLEKVGHYVPFGIEEARAATLLPTSDPSGQDRYSVLEFLRPSGCITNEASGDLSARCVPDANEHDRSKCQCCGLLHSSMSDSYILSAKRRRARRKREPIRCCSSTHDVRQVQRFV